MGVSATPLSRPDALRQVAREVRVARAQLIYGSECGGSFLPAPPDHQPLALLSWQGIYALVSFTPATSYDTALDGIENLGLRLADRCYEAAPTSWHQMGQAAAFGKTYSLQVATTYYSPISWRSMLLQLPGATQVTVLPSDGC